MRPAVQSEWGARQVLSAPADSPATERPDGGSAMPGLLHRVKGKTAEIRACSARFRAENAEQRFAEREIHKICHGIAVLTAPFFNPFDQHPDDGVCVKTAERLPVGRGRRPARPHLAAGEEGIHALQKLCAEKPLQFIPPEEIVCAVQDRVIFFHKGHDKQEILSDDEKDVHAQWPAVVPPSGTERRDGTGADRLLPRPPADGKGVILAQSVR